MATAGKTNTHPDVVLIGAGIMSATLASLLKEVRPDLSITVIEQLKTPAEESSNAWNNAGTGHAALCELNYTPEKKDGSVEIAKAIDINAQFDVSRQFWSYLVRKGVIKNPRDFIHPVPHLSFVRGEKDVAFLKKRFEALSAHHCFKGMEYTEDKKRIAEWTPLVMEGRDAGEKVAATRMKSGTDVDFGALTRLLLKDLAKQSGISIHYETRVSTLKREAAGWKITTKGLADGKRHTLHAKHVFIGAGGGSLPLLQKSGIPEGHGFGGFPVSGIWLRSDNQELCARHDAKVYGKAAVGAPPMSVPHLDTRKIDGKVALLFGPYAGFSTKFLKNGSYADLPTSVGLKNLKPMLIAGRDNIPLTKYLVKEVMKSTDARMESLHEYFPQAKKADWRIEVAGQRVQIIKKDPKKGGILQFGTELVGAADNSIIALLGASPGASTSVSAMIEVLERFLANDTTSGWKKKLQEVIPSYGKSLAKDPALCAQLRAETATTLKISQD